MEANLIEVNDFNVVNQHIFLCCLVITLAAAPLKMWSLSRSSQVLVHHQFILLNTHCFVILFYGLMLNSLMGKCFVQDRFSDTGSQMPLELGALGEGIVAISACVVEVTLHVSSNMFLQMVFLHIFFTLCVPPDDP